MDYPRLFPSMDRSPKDSQHDPLRSHTRKPPTPPQEPTVVAAPRLPPQAQERQSVTPQQHESHRNDSPEEVFDLEKFENGGICHVCLTNPATVVLLPCGHCTLCPGCWHLCHSRGQMTCCSLDRQAIRSTFELKKEELECLRRKDYMYYNVKTAKCEEMDEEIFKRLNDVDQKKYTKIVLSSRLLIQTPSTQDTTLETQDTDVELKKLLYKLQEMNNTTRNPD
jgi:hypothetical protein